MKGQTVNNITLYLMRKLLESSDYGNLDSELGSTSDVELLLNFIFQVCVPLSRSSGNYNLLL